MFILSLLFSAVLFTLAVNGEGHRSCGKKGQFAMTFDNGPSDYTPQLLDHLKRANVKATFHFVIDYIKDPAVESNIQLAIDDGHLIGLKLGKVPDDEDSAIFLKKHVDIMEEAFGIQLEFVRIHYNDRENTDLLKAIKANNMVLTWYNLDSYDYQEEATKETVIEAFEKAVNRISERSLGRFISLQNDNAISSIEATPSIINLLTTKGYDLVRLDDCLKLDSTNDSQNPDPAPASPGNRETGEISDMSDEPSSDASALSLVNPLILFLAFPFYLLSA